MGDPSLACARRAEPQPSAARVPNDAITLAVQCGGCGVSVAEIGDPSIPILVLTLDKALSRDWALHVGDRQFPVADAALINSDKSATWNNPGFSWTSGQKVSLRLTTGGGAVGLSGLGVSSAAVDGKALTVTFTGNLDTGSVPAPRAFRVTVNGARRNVAAGGVAISGKTVRLTLASAVSVGAAHGERPGLGLGPGRLRKRRHDDCAGGEREPAGAGDAAVPGTAGTRRSRRCAHGRRRVMKRRVKLVPPIEKVRLRELAATDGAAYLGVELEHHATGGEATRLELGLNPEDAAALGPNLTQLGEKLRAAEH